MSYKESCSQQWAKLLALLLWGVIYCKSVHVCFILLAMFYPSDSPSPVSTTSALICVSWHLPDLRSNVAWRMESSSRSDDLSQPAGKTPHLPSDGSSPFSRGRYDANSVGVEHIQRLGGGKKSGVVFRRLMHQPLAHFPSFTPRPD